MASTSSTALSSLVAGAISLLPLRARVLTKEQLNRRFHVVRPMDFPGQAILLHVDSHAELEMRLRSCAKEPDTIQWIRDYIGPGDIVFDIGANVGAYSLVIDRHTQGTAKVYAFEPGAPTFVQLVRNVNLNGCSDRVLPMPVAFGASNGVETFNYSRVIPGAALHAIGEPVDSLGRRFEPAMRQAMLIHTLDAFVASFGIDRPTHMKIDVDGPELDILKGGRQVIQDPGLRTVLIELEPGKPTGEAAAALLISAGFREASKRKHPGNTETTNYLFVRESAR